MSSYKLSFNVLESGFIDFKVQGLIIILRQYINEFDKLHKTYNSQCFENLLQVSKVVQINI